MQDLEQRYFERVHAAQTRHNEAMDAARAEHDAEVLAAREELSQKASDRFSVLFGKSPHPAPSDAAKTMIEDMIADVLTKKFEGVARLVAPTVEGDVERRTSDDNASD